MPEERPPAGDRGNAFVQFYRYAFGIGHERNVGGVERTVRYTAGAGFVLLGLLVLLRPVLASGSVNTAVAALVIGSGGYLIYEARVQYCPLNRTLGRSTYEPDR